MRISSDLWIRALLRRCAGGGAPAFVVRRGDAERGALFVKVATLDGRARLFGPAPASLHEATSERTLVPHLAPDGAPESEIDTYMARQVEFDPDLWLVEIEDRAGRSFIDD